MAIISESYKLPNQIPHKVDYKKALQMADTPFDHCIALMAIIHPSIACIIERQRLLYNCVKLWNLLLSDQKLIFTWGMTIAVVVVAVRFIVCCLLSFLLALLLTPVSILVSSSSLRASPLDSQCWWFVKFCCLFGFVVLFILSNCCFFFFFTTYELLNLFIWKTFSQSRHKQLK